MGALLVLGRLGRDTRGLAFTEFAIVLPVLLTLIFYGLEVANLALTHMRVSQISMTVADNAGRVNTAMDELNINEVFSGADLVGTPIDFRPNGRIVLSSLMHNGKSGTTAGQTINWQRCFGSLNVAPAYGRQGDGASNASLRNGLGPTGNRITAAPGTAVMFVEVTYDYQPLISNALLGARQIRYESALNVRERTNQQITNTSGLPLNRC